MKGLFSVCILLGLLITSPAQSQELYDDFKGHYSALKSGLPIGW